LALSYAGHRAGYQIVVPVGLWNQLKETERLAVLHHELCHLRRGDLWKAFWRRLRRRLCIGSIHSLGLRRLDLDESAEWASDFRNLPKRPPTESAELANALLVATETQQPTRRISDFGSDRRPRVSTYSTPNVAPSIAKDPWMKRTLWLSIFLIVITAGGIRWQLQPSSTLNAMTPPRRRRAEDSKCRVQRKRGSTAK
jgi:beta-lactamase regulating signal transducer with metallopeptidase domain